MQLFTISTLYTFILLLYVLPSLANTEIRNFKASYDDEELGPISEEQLNSLIGSLKPGRDLPVLHPLANEGAFHGTPAELFTPLEDVCEEDRVKRGERGESVEVRTGAECPNEIWVKLDFDGSAGGEGGAWDRYSMFTLRLSWPANYPADFDISIYTPAMLLDRYGIPRDHAHTRANASDNGTFQSPRKARTRIRYARIRLVDRGVRSTASLRSQEVHHHHHRRASPVDPVPFNLILEPLYFGVLPASLLPTLLGACALLAASSFFLLNRVYGYLCAVAGCARDELSKTE